MSTSRRRKMQSEARLAKKAVKEEINNMISVFVRLGCGCCDEMKFRSEESAWNRSELGIYEIIDDAGKSWNVDTFYGHSFSEEEMDGRGLEYLMEQVAGK